MEISIDKLDDVTLRLSGQEALVLLTNIDVLINIFQRDEGLLQEYKNNNKVHLLAMMVLESLMTKKETKSIIERLINDPFLESRMESLTAVLMKELNL